MFVVLLQVAKAKSTFLLASLIAVIYNYSSLLIIMLLSHWAAVAKCDRSFVNGIRKRVFLAISCEKVNCEKVSRTLSLIFNVSTR